MRTLTRSIALATIATLAATGAASALRTIVPFGTYKGKALKGASWKVAAPGNKASFHGMVIVGLLCGPKTQQSGSTSTGQSAAKVLLNSTSAPTIKINNHTGGFTGSRRYHGDTVTIVGKFSANAKQMVFTVKTTGDCSSSKYTFHSTA